MRLTPPRFGSRNPLNRQVQLLLEGEMMQMPRLVVGGERQHQRSFIAQFDIDPGRFRELRRERGPAQLAFAAKRHQGRLSRFRLGAGREHSGGRVTGAGSRGAPVEDLNRHAARGQPPGNGKANDSRADNGDGRLVMDA
jgi:hypothetical protein